MSFSDLSDLIVYQVYPRSFFDSNNDGIGDIPGIEQKLDYLTDTLGVNAVWITSPFRSPMVDYGYDVSDHCAIDSSYGSLEDMRLLIKACHARGVAVLLDFIPNHTSDQHPWFQESRSSRTNPRRDWYIWQDPRPDGSAPNNWLSIFSGSAWEYDARSSQYYLHSFAKEQPDLNVRNPKVQKALLEILDFWMAQGVDGFRLDAVIHIFKDPSLSDEPQNPRYTEGTDDPYKKLEHYPTTRIHPDMYDFIAQISDYVCKRHNKLLVTEAYETPVRLLTRMYEAADSPLYTSFNFELLWLPWSAHRVRRAIERYERMLPEGSLSSYVLSNHDVARLVTRVGVDKARLMSVLLFTLRGIPYIYYGSEIGMENGVIPPEFVSDPRERLVPGMGMGRDPVRTPMQWSADIYAGFSRSTPWLPVGANTDKVNVTSQLEDPSSLLQVYRDLIALRKEHPSLRSGRYQSLRIQSRNVLAYERVLPTERCIVVLNMNARVVNVSLDSVEKKIVFCTHQRESISTAMRGKVTLEAYEGIVIVCPVPASRPSPSK